jgi:protein CpxP
MKKRNILITTMLVAAIPVLILSGPVSAFKGGHCLERGGLHQRLTGMGGMPFGGRMGGMLRMMDALDLTKEQREKIWNIMDEKRTQLRTYMISMHEGRKQVHEAAAEGDYDAAQVRKLADAQGKAMADLIVLRTSTRVEVQSVLTPEQQAKFKELRDQRRGKFLKH